MVEDAITDGRRIAELLSSELTGLRRGPLADVTVVDADPDATPTPDGAFAYAIEFDGDRVGTVVIEPDAAVLVLEERSGPGGPGHPGLSAEQGDGYRLTIDRGAAVKAAVDALEHALDQ